jgi:hypothetical protein
MCNSTNFAALEAREPKIEAFDVAHRIKSMMPTFIIPHSLRDLMDLAYDSLTSPKIKTGFLVFILCSLLTATIAATDCEILNSGISSISSNACCTKTAAIVCVNDRVTEM